MRVDVFYAKFSPRGKAIADIITSVFFFIFVGTLLLTGWRFAMDCDPAASAKTRSPNGASSTGR